MDHLLRRNDSILRNTFMNLFEFYVTAPTMAIDNEENSIAEMCRCGGCTTIAFLLPVLPACHICALICQLSHTHALHVQS